VGTDEPEYPEVARGDNGQRVSKDSLYGPFFALFFLRTFRNNLAEEKNPIWRTSGIEGSRR
jgi:hypothetical protein